MAAPRPLLNSRYFTLRLRPRLPRAWRRRSRLLPGQRSRRSLRKKMCTSRTLSTSPGTRAGEGTAEQGTEGRRARAAEKVFFVFFCSCFFVSMGCARFLFPSCNFLELAGGVGQWNDFGRDGAVASERGESGEEGSLCRRRHFLFLPLQAVTHIFFRKNEKREGGACALIPPSLSLRTLLQRERERETVEHAAGELQRPRCGRCRRRRTSIGKQMPRWWRRRRRRSATPATTAVVVLFIAAAFAGAENAKSLRRMYSRVAETDRYVALREEAQKKGAVGARCVLKNERADAELASTCKPVVTLAHSSHAVSIRKRDFLLFLSCQYCRFFASYTFVAKANISCGVVRLEADFSLLLKNISHRRPFLFLFRTPLSLWKKKRPRRHAPPRRCRGLEGLRRARRTAPAVGVRHRQQQRWESPLLGAHGGRRRLAGRGRRGLGARRSRSELFFFFASSSLPLPRARRDTGRGRGP